MFRCPARRGARLGAVPVVLGKPDAAVGELDGALEHGCPASVDRVHVGDPLELVRGLPSAPELTCGKRDLDLSGKTPERPSGSSSSPQALA